MKKFCRGAAIGALILLFSASAFGQDAGEANEEPDLLEFSKSGSLQEIRDALGQGADANLCDVSGETPLMYAAEYDRPPDVLAELLRGGANVNARNSAGMTPLMYAAAYGTRLELISLLLSAGADPYARDETFTTPLMFAIENDRSPEIVAMLRKATSDTKTRH
jgi:ankyrin repeat protein